MNSKRIGNREFISVIFADIYFLWALMPIFTAEYATDTIRMTFLGIILLAIFFALIETSFVIKRDRLLLLIVILIASYYIMGVFNYMDAHKYVNVVCFFWFPFVLSLIIKEKQRIQIARWITFLLIVTFFTSAIGVISDNSVSRTIAHATSDINLQITISKRNIAGIYLFQMTVILLPSIIAIFDYLNKKIEKYVTILFLVFVLINASYSITLFMALFALVLVAFMKNIEKNTNIYHIFIIGVLLILFLILLVAGDAILSLFARFIANERIALRIEELRFLLYGGVRNSGFGDVSERLKLYLTSLNTFKDNVFIGIGPYYSFVKLQNGIGYHSQIFDDCARFGLVGVIFYVVFIREYYVKIKEEWNKCGYTWVALSTMIIYVLFLILNIGFRSDFESAVLAFVVPAFPYWINCKKGRDVDEEFE